MDMANRKDSKQNESALHVLITLTELLKSSNSIVSRNKKLLVIDMRKASDLLKREITDLGKLFIQSKLIVDHNNIFGTMSIITELFVTNNILFCSIADSISSEFHEKDERYPFHTNARDWFFSIPNFSENETDEYEAIYKKNNSEINLLMRKNAGELYKSLVSVANSADKRQMH